MPELVEPLAGTSDFTLISQGAEAVRLAYRVAYETIYSESLGCTGLCRKYGRAIFWEGQSS